MWRYLSEEAAMPKNDDAADWGTVVSLFLAVKKWKHQALADAAGIDPRMISRYELGNESPSPETLRKLADALPLPADWLPLLFEIARTVRQRAESGGAAPAVEDLTSGLERLVAASSQLASAPARLDLAVTLGRSGVSDEEERRLAAELWKELEGASPHERRLLVEATWDYQGRAVVGEACAASERAAASDPRRALELAELALTIARRTPAGEERAFLEGRVLAFEGNARRVASQRAAAEDSFSRSRHLRDQCATIAPPGEEAQLLDLEASLRRDQLRLSEALSLHEAALAVAQPQQLAMILLNKSIAFNHLQDYEAALQALQGAQAAVTPEIEPRISLGIMNNTAATYCRLRRYTEAAGLLPRARVMARALGNDLDIARLCWVEGRTAIGLARRSEARAALEHAAHTFAEHEIDEDRGLVSLELTDLYLDAGELDRARDLAREALEIFERQEVPHEMLSALKVFYQAAEKQRATPDLARRLLAYLDRTRHEPGLKFEG